MFIVLLLQDVRQRSDGSVHSLGPATAPLPRAHATEASDLSAAPPFTVPVSLSPWKTVAPRPAFLPSGQDVTKVSQLMAVIASTQPAWEAGEGGRCFFHRRDGNGTQRSLSDLAEPSPGARVEE